MQSMGLNLKKEDITRQYTKAYPKIISQKIITDALTITCFPENLSNGAGANLK